MQKPLATILIVEDEKLIARDVQILLEALGYHVPAILKSAEESFLFLEHTVPDLIIMDIKLEGEQDGIEIAGRIKASHDIPVIFLTAHADDAYINRAGIVDPAGYILKPFEEKELEITVKLALYKHRTDRKLQDREARFKRLFEHMPIGLYEASDNGNLISVNTALLDMLQYPSREVLLQETLESRYLNREDRDRWYKGIREHGLLQNFETQWKKYNGTGLWVLESVRAVYDRHRNIIGIEGAVQNITAQKTTEKELRAARDMLGNYCNQMKEYARIASHDLEDPLRLVSGYARLLEKQVIDKKDAEADDFISYIIDGTERMHLLIQDFMDYTRVLSKTPEKIDFDTEAIIDSVHTRLKPELHDIDAKIEYEPLPEIHADPGMIQLLFEHLIDNAIKYRSDSPPRIHISARTRPTGYEFTVQDNGIGVPKAYQDQIFHLFKQMHGGRTDFGTGLGLAICKQIVKKHGGVIWVKSDNGEGAAFCFTLQAGNAVCPVNPMSATHQNTSDP
ncbi:response regulator [bacterium]|nr:response regulator [bacterium]